MCPSPSHDPQRTSPWFLRRLDQLGVAAMVAAGMAATVAWWMCHGGMRGGVVELDATPTKIARFEVDINQADWPELLQLPEIGETLAKRIVESRKERGPFVDHDDLRRVRGIGPKTLERVRPYLRPMPTADSIAGKAKPPPNG